MTQFRTRLAAFALALGMLLEAPLAHAQTPVAPALPAAQAKAALDALKDPAQRAKLISILEVLAAQPAAPAGKVLPATAAAPVPATPPVVATTTDAPAAAAEKPAIVLAPNSVGAQVLVGASRQLNDLSGEVVDVVRTITDFPLLWSWLTWLATDQTVQLAILDASWRLIVVMVAGLIAEFLVRRALRRPLQSLRDRAPVPSSGEPVHQGLAEAEAGQTEWIIRRANAVSLIRRLPFVAGCFLLELLPVMALLAAGSGMLAAGMAGGLTSRQVILAVLGAAVGWRLLQCAARLIASPDAPRLRLIPISDENAVVFVHEVVRIGAVAIGGYALAESALLFGLYLSAHDAMLQLVALLVYILVVRIVLRNRRGMRNLLRAPEGSTGALVVLRNGFASAWHRILIVYLLALWVVWALDIADGFARLLRVMLAALLVGLAARLLSMAAESMLNRLLDASDGLDERYPGMEARLAGYHPLARALLNLAVTIVAIVALFEAWGINAIAWFAPEHLGGRMISAGGTIVLTLMLALVTWELTNAAIARHLAQLARNAQLARSARLRTLLPMFRTTLLITVCLVASLVILSEIGVNIAPLLAGAGVIGLAIGFGSQKLVQDIITGLFLLLENAMQVGDVVTLGGMSGTVENLSIRTIRLRALDGAVHIVPFSAVTTVTNSTRDYGFALSDVIVGLNEEPDRIADILRELAAKMRTESPWRGLILADLEMMGVEKFVASGWVMRVRIKTLPASRWSVGRELNRRIKYRFDELAIDSPMTSYRVLGIAPPPPNPSITPFDG